MKKPYSPTLTPPSRREHFRSSWNLSHAKSLEPSPRRVAIPTIGIGAGPDCDGQVLVSCDMLGLTEDFHPKFLKRYVELREAASAAVETYVEEVREGLFPDAEHSHQ